jgi:hypothetical protein
VTDVEDAAQLFVKLLLVIKCLFGPSQRVSLRRVETAFSPRRLPLYFLVLALQERLAFQPRAPDRPQGLFLPVFLRVQHIQSFLEAARMALLGFRQGLEPIRNFVKTFIARRTCHARIHIRVFVRFAGD